MQRFMVIRFNMMFWKKLNYKRFHREMKAFICVCFPMLPNVCAGCSHALRFRVLYIQYFLCV